MADRELPGPAPGADERRGPGGRARADTPELGRLRRRIDALDRRIVSLLNERARLGIAIGAEKRAAGRRVLDADREREVLLRVAMANEGPLPRAEILALYRRLIRATRRAEHEAAGTPEGRRDSPASPE